MITDDVVGRPTEIRFFYKEQESDNYVVYFPNFNLTARDPGQYLQGGAISSVSMGCNLYDWAQVSAGKFKYSIQSRDTLQGIKLRKLMLSIKSLTFDFGLVTLY